ncbi:MAG: PLP-dependent aminotransferase family protein [Planctomycetes bacterium]|nr:PLP-dependent aminotransferase family protein [Planctomycetota bacterium]
MKAREPAAKRRGIAKAAATPPLAARTLHQSLLRELQAMAAEKDSFPFALGMPAAELFPRDAIAEAVRLVLSRDPVALQYAVPFEPLKLHVVKRMAARGVACTGSQVFLTAGAQQGINLLVRLLLEPGGHAVVEDATYDGMLMALRPLACRPLTVETDLESGMHVEGVDAVLQSGARPAFVYTIPDGHNPCGVSLSVAKRARLAEIARTHEVPVIEDDAYGFLNYSGPAPPLVRAHDAQWVFTIGSFSKVLAPSLRVGWIVAPEAVVARLSILKHSSDLDVSTLAQRAVSAYLDTGAFDDHVATLRREYVARRDAMGRALEAHFPSEARYRVPAAGLFYWVELPRRVDTNDVLRVALAKERVAFVPGRAIAADDGDRVSNFMRLSFSACTPERIEAGIRRLGRVVKEALR